MTEVLLFVWSIKLLESYHELPWGSEGWWQGRCWQSLEEVQRWCQKSATASEPSQARLPFFYYREEGAVPHWYWVMWHNMHQFETSSYWRNNAKKEVWNQIQNTMDGFKFSQTKKNHSAVHRSIACKTFVCDTNERILLVGFVCSSP